MEPLDKCISFKFESMENKIHHIKFNTCELMKSSYLTSLVSDKHDISRVDIKLNVPMISIKQFIFIFTGGCIELDKTKKELMYLLAIVVVLEVPSLYLLLFDILESKYEPGG